MAVRTLLAVALVAGSVGMAFAQAGGGAGGAGASGVGAGGNASGTTGTVIEGAGGTSGSLNSGTTVNKPAAGRERSAPTGPATTIPPGGSNETPGTPR